MYPTAISSTQTHKSYEIYISRFVHIRILSLVIYWAEVWSFCNAFVWPKDPLGCNVVKSFT